MLAYTGKSYPDAVSNNNQELAMLTLPTPRTGAPTSFTRARDLDGGRRS